MNKANISSSAELFLYKARVDLRAAQYMYNGFLNDNLEIDIEKIYFDLQQATEKIIKSQLSFQNIVSPRTHDLELLENVLSENGIVLTDIHKLLPLTEFAVEGRYSIILDDIDNAQYYIDIIEVLIEEVTVNISFRGV